MPLNCFNPLDFPIGLALPQRISATHWEQHIPFAFTLIAMLRPRTVVELGLSSGDSYCAFCQAIDTLGLDSRAYGILGGPDAAEALPELGSYHDLLYGRFSRLILTSSQEALSSFADRSIDLLHIDGEQDYEAARREFLSWLPKMSGRGVILLHATNVREEGCGVWKLWEEVQARYPSFEFPHQHGLGVLAVGPDCPESLTRLLGCTDTEAALLQVYYVELGKRIGQLQENGRLQLADNSRQREYRQALGALRQHLAAAEQSVQVLRLQIRERDALLRHERERSAEHRRTQAAALAELADLKVSLAFRVAHAVSGLFHRLAPVGSQRRRVLGLTRRGVRVLRHQGMLAFSHKALRHVLPQGQSAVAMQTEDAGAAVMRRRVGP
jgi:hypothetical protein